MPPRKRRKPRHVLHPLRFIPAETWALIAKSVAGGLVVAAPAVAVRQEGVAKAQTANEERRANSEALNVALGASAALQESLSVFREQFGQFQQEMRESRRRDRDVRARLPENAVGPALPTAWKPAKRHWWDIRGG